MEGRGGRRKEEEEGIGSGRGWRWWKGNVDQNVLVRYKIADQTFAILMSCRLLVS